MGSSPVRMENRYVRIAAGESRIARPPRTAFPDSKSDKHKERETTDSPPPTRLSNEGFCLNEVQTFDSKAPHSSIPQTGSRKIVLDHHSSSVIGPRPVHSSAPAGRRLPRNHRSPSKISSSPSQHRDLRCYNNVRRELSPESSMPTSITAEARLKVSDRANFLDYSALSSLPSVMMRGKGLRSNADLFLDGSNSNLYNKLNKLSSGESASQNNASSHEEEYSESPLSRIRGPISAGVASDRRGSKRLNARSPMPMSPFLIAEKEFEESISLTSARRSATPPQKESSSITFWSRTKSAEPMLPDFEATKDHTSLCEEPVKEFTGFEGSSSCNLSRRSSGTEDFSTHSINRYFGLSFGRRKLKPSNSMSPKSSSQEPLSAKSSLKSPRKVLKMVSKLGKSIGKKLPSGDVSKHTSIKGVLKNILSLQTVSMDGVLSGLKRTQSGTTLSSDGLESCSTIDMEDIKKVDPQLYSTILETVASWCDGPTPEPEDRSDALSTRTFSSISFRERSASQDLSNFEAGTALAEEEAFLQDVVEGKIETESVSSADTAAVTRREQDVSTPVSPTKENETGSDMESLMEAIDHICNVPNTPTEPLSTRSSFNGLLPSSFLHLTDSDSEEEYPEKEAGDGFLHITSSEMESIEVESMKDVLKMQGIWLYDWKRNAEIKELAEKWKMSPGLEKYSFGADGIELVVENQIVKCFRYSISKSRSEAPIERIFLDQIPPSCSKTLNLKGFLTSLGLRTSHFFPADGSHREELVWIEGDGLCVQVKVKLPVGEQKVSRVYLERPVA